MDIGSYVTLGSGSLVVAVAALAISGGAWRTSRHAAAHAKRSADAAEQQAAAAAEALALQREASRPRVKLNIDRLGAGTWLLENGGTADAVNLALHSDDVGLVDWEDPPGPVLAQGEVRRLSARYMADTPPVLRFTWDGQEEPVSVRCPSQA